MKRKDFYDLPMRKWNEDIGPFDGLIHLPTKRKHGSGFMFVDFVAFIDLHPICRLTDCSDVAFILSIDRVSVDCLPCGLTRTFTRRLKYRCDSALSTFYYLRRLGMEAKTTFDKRS